jgi:hypothetical protein
MKKKRIRAPLLSEDTLSLKPSLHFFDDLRTGILEYISERYRGAFQIEETKVLSGYVTVAHDALCFFIRLLLNDLFGKTLLRISYGQRSKAEIFYLRFAYDKNVEISEKERYRLLWYAKYAKVGFEYEETETDAIITLTMPSQSSLFQCVYVPSPVNGFFLALSDIELSESEDRGAVITGAPSWKSNAKSKQ